MLLRVAIVGCGTAGPAAALFLHRLGHHVTVFERVPGPGPVGAGIVVQPTGMTALARLGLLGEIVAAGERLERLRGWTTSGRVVMDLRYADLHPAFFGLGLHRGDLFSALTNALERDGVEVRCGVDVASVDGRRLRDADGEDLGTFDLIVVADGARSELRGRSQLRKRATPYPFGALWIVAADPDRNFAGSLDQYYSGTRRMLGFLATGTTPAQGDSTSLVSLFWSLPADAVDNTRRRGLPAFREQVLAMSARAEPVLDQIADIDALLFAQYWDVRMPRWHEDGVLYIGDAAHAMSPQLGQGANLALLDAMVLADSLEASTSVAEGLDRYTKARRGHLRFYQMASRWLTPVFQSHLTPIAWGRDALFGPLSRAPWVKGQMLRSLAGLKTGPFGAWPVTVTDAYLRALDA